jgi:hypothetical protein
MSRKKALNGFSSTPTKTRNFKQELPCKLSVDEHTKISERLAAAIAVRTELETNKKENARKFTDDIAATKRQIATLRDEVEKHEQMRVVECVEEQDFAANKVVVTRKDTGETIEERAMQPEERERLAQPDLPSIPTKPTNDITDPGDGAESRD